MAARRIVSLVPSTTESVCALGAAARLVGCTRYCIEPAAELAAVPRIGGTKNPSRERIAALAPDLVLGNAEENRAEDLQWLRERFPLLVHTPTTVVEAAAALRELAAALDASEVLVPFLLRVEAQLAAAAAAHLGLPPVRVFYAVWAKPWMGVARGTFVHDVLRCLGAANVTADASSRYPEVDPAALAECTDLVLLPDEPWEFGDADVAELEAAATFGRARLLRCSGRDFCWHGTAMADGLGRAAALLQRARAH